MIGRQLPVMALLLPFYVMFVYGGWRSIRDIWPVLLVAGGSFAISQFVASNFIDYSLTDVLASLGSLAVTLAFLQVWKGRTNPEFAIVEAGAKATVSTNDVPKWQGWLPWLIVSAVVIVWTSFNISAIGQHGDPLARPRQGDLDHALRRQALCGGLDVRAARDRHLHPARGDDHRARRAARASRISSPASRRPSRQIWLAVVTVCLIVGARLSS